MLYPSEMWFTDELQDFANLHCEKPMEYVWEWIIWHPIGKSKHNIRGAEFIIKHDILDSILPPPLTSFVNLDKMFNCSLSNFAHL